MHETLGLPPVPPLHFRSSAPPMTLAAIVMHPDLQQLDMGSDTIAPPPLAVSVRQPPESTCRNTWTPSSGTSTTAPPPKRSQSHNQLVNCIAPSSSTNAKLSPLKLESMTPTLLATSTSRDGRITPPTETSATLATTTSSPPLHNRTRRGSLILHATMKAMNLFTTPSASQDVVSPSRDRLKSNQDDDGDSSDEDEAVLDSNQHEEPSTAGTRSSPPPYFRLRTFLLEDESHASHMTSPTAQQTPPSPRLPSCVSSPRRQTPSSKAAQIDGIFQEIWNTEQSYVAALRGLVTRFFEPLQTYAKQNDITLGAMGALFHSTSTILSIHEELLRQLEPIHNPEASTSSTSAQPSASTSDPFGVGFTGTLARLHQLCKAFLSTIEYMKVYAFYCGSYLSAKQELERLQRQHPRLAAFTTQLNENALRGSDEGLVDPSAVPEYPPIDINSNLIKPVQRICRYPLLFKSLLSNATGPEETLILQQSLQKIEAVSNYVNEKVRESQNNARLYQLHQMLHPSSNLELLQPSRTLIHEAWANITSLDAPRWPAKILKHFRRRRHRRRSSLQSRLSQVSASVARDDWSRLSVFGDDRRSSATVTANILKSHLSGGRAGVVGGDRNTSFSNASTNAEYVPPPQRLMRRRSSGGERTRLILLSDMLLMAKLKDRQLKVRRQICLSCAVIHDDTIPVVAQQTSDNVEAQAGEDDDLLSPRARMSTAAGAAASVVSALELDKSSHAFTLEVSKVGRCSCHHFSPATLKRSPKHNSLGSFLTARRNSLSISVSAMDIMHSLQRQSTNVDDLDLNRELGNTDLTRSPSMSHRISSRSSKSGSTLRYLEHLAGFRSVKRYRISCDSVAAKTEFLKALRTAIDRSARLMSVGSSSNGAIDRSRCASSNSAQSATSTSSKAVNLPTRIWRSLMKPSNALPPDTGSPREQELTGSQSGLSSLSRRQRDSLTIMCRENTPRNTTVSTRHVTSRDADLLQLDSPASGGLASVEEATPSTSTALV